MDRKIVVIGSANIDLFMKVKSIPKPGETVIGGEVYKSYGGKGANQAVAAARSGGEVVFIANLGDDSEGIELIENFNKELIDTSKIRFSKDKSTGLALIFVDENGENSIAVSSGANEYLSKEIILTNQKLIQDAKLLLMQLEIPVESVKLAAKIAFENHVEVILNPAPALEIDDELIKYISIITPNIHEIEKLTGIKVITKNDALKASHILIEKGVRNVIITNGKNGVFVCNNGEVKYFPTYNVPTVDTTAAGDVFNGVLATIYSNEQDIFQAVNYAIAASAISVTRKGSQNSAPKINEIEEFIKNNQLKELLTKKEGVINE